jgi:hypothetical protein
VRISSQRLVEREMALAVQAAFTYRQHEQRTIALTARPSVIALVAVGKLLTDERIQS